MKPCALVFALAAAMGNAVACGGTAIDLERKAPPNSSQAGGPPMIVSEEVQVEHSVNSLSADDSNVYWVADFATQSKLWSCTFQDCAATSRTFADTPGPVLVTSEDFFLPSPSVMNLLGDWEQTLLRCSRSGCNGIPSGFVNDNVGAFNADAEALYWASKFDIYRCPLSGCPEIPERVAARLSDDPSLSGPNGLATGGTNNLLFAGDSVYWVSGNVVYNAAKDGSRTATRVTTIHAAYPAIAIDELYLYWVDGTSQIVSCPLAHCSDAPATPLVATGTPKDNLYVDGRGLYWREYVGDPSVLSSAVYFCPLSGCSNPQRLTDAPVDLMTFSAHYLYWTKLDWTERSNNLARDPSRDREATILRVPKPTL